MTERKTLDLSVLHQALYNLREAVDERKQDLNNSFVRDAMIQRFEYCYELSHKMLKRYLELSEPNSAAIDLMSFPELIRTASERGLLLNGWDHWKSYRDARNITSHTYNEDKAIQICLIIPLFLNEAEYLANILEKIVKHYE
jgi:nucleotidyltransferase substrate binding protein (TIGR01987 family)